MSEKTFARFEMFEAAAGGGAGRLVPVEPEPCEDPAIRREAGAIGELIWDKYLLCPRVLIRDEVGRIQRGPKRHDRVWASLGLREGEDGKVLAVYTQGYEHGGRFELEFDPFDRRGLGEQIAGLPKHIRKNLSHLLETGEPSTDTGGRIPR